MLRIGATFAFVVLLSLLSGATVAGQEPETVVDMVVNDVDDTTCADGIGRTFRSATVLSAAQNDDEAAFFARHEACAGMSDRAASVGLTPLPVGLIAKCSGAVALPGWQYEWVICQLGFLAKEGLTTPVHIELGDFVLLTQDDQKFAPYVDADLYVGQLYDMSAGIDFLGPDPAYGDIAFPVVPGSAQPPFVILWTSPAISSLPTNWNRRWPSFSSGICSRIRPLEGGFTRWRQTMTEDERGDDSNRLRDLGWITDGGAVYPDGGVEVRLRRSPDTSGKGERSIYGTDFEDAIRKEVERLEAEESAGEP